MKTSKDDLFSRPMVAKRQIYTSLLKYERDQLTEQSILYIEAWLEAPRKVRRLCRRLVAKGISPFYALLAASKKLSPPERRAKKKKPDTAPKKPYNTTKEDARRKRQMEKRNAKKH